MEKERSFKEAMVKLPPGFRFHPTDEELVIQYLKRKVFSCPLPSSIIADIDIYKHDPWELPGEEGQEKYFFNIKEAKYPNGNRPNRAAATGYWKATGIDKPVLSSRSNQVVGMKKSLVFYRGKAPKGVKTDWIMHEYRLAEAGAKPCNISARKSSIQNYMAPVEDWVVCRIFLKKRGPKREARVEHGIHLSSNYRTGFIDFMLQQQNSRNAREDINNEESSSCSSTLTSSSSKSA
ncbi:hypothetical protein AMTRI_Chr06g192100 [Amborella trichopoda]|uniref:NAC domain-containing protein n=1 Tax=Amborella trichopoda TaxID=13333 RepID=W1PEX0_AMBTC|nr:NAC domain-containing protein 83 [Amborella trichopoda]ERN06249.1 hypothetical protein AMTR_s00016p00196760 [Amborella trichopoda]|eukprot:XP_006844574.1 NAC domain-containing protein 83 [Amborella trichopoda]